MLLLYSLRTDVLFEESLFKFIKDESDCFYLTDIQVYKKSQSTKVWGFYTERKAHSPSKGKMRRRPASSPERLQRKVDMPEDSPKEDCGALIMPKDSPRKKCKSVFSRVKTSGFLKLEPILPKRKF